MDQFKQTLKKVKRRFFNMKGIKRRKSIEQELKQI